MIGAGRLFTFSPRIAAGALAAMLVACGTPDADNLAPRQTPAERSANHFMVSSAHPLATAAGVAVLREGGNAVDAAVAVQMVLGFVEPAESGIGGGGFLLHRDGASGRLQVFDGRETAPSAARADRFTLFGQPVPLWAAVPSGRAVGVPGLVAMLGRAHEAHGSLPWTALLQPAIELADTGVVLPAHLRGQIGGDPTLKLFGDLRELFIEPAETGLLRNPALAETLRTLAEEGPQALYAGTFASDFAERAAAGPLWAGDLTAVDVAGYRAQTRAALCGRYREWTVCGAPPPSSGGVAVLQILGMLERFPLDELGPDSADAIHLIAEASRLAFADREWYLGDPDFVDVPVAGLIDRNYLARRATRIDPSRTRRDMPPGAPRSGGGVAADARPEFPAEKTGTSHFSIVDADGNLVALTSSNEAPFGARRSTRGVLLNNQLTDFSFDPLLPDGSPHPNAIAPGKRPRSSMSPVMVFDSDGEMRLVIGSRGGARIIGYVVKTLIGVLDWGLDVQDAIALPNFGHRGRSLELERGTTVTRHRAALEAMGHDVTLVRMTSGLHGVERTPDGLRGGADPRLDGSVAGG